MKAKTPVVSAIAVVVGAVLAFALNPSAERHRAAIKEAIGERNPVARVMNLGALAGFVSNYHSLGVASYTRVGERTLSVGAFGLVYVLQ